MNGPFTIPIPSGGMAFDIQGQTFCLNREAITAQTTCDSVCGAGEVCYPNPSGISSVMTVVLDCLSKYLPVSTRGAKSFLICFISCLETICVLKHHYMQIFALKLNKFVK